MIDVLDEPEIIINGFKLTVAEAMTVRVAMGSFAISLAPEDSLGSDTVGKGIRAGYISAGNSIQSYMMHPRTPT